MCWPGRGAPCIGGGAGDHGGGGGGGAADGSAAEGAELGRGVWRAEGTCEVGGEGAPAWPEGGAEGKGPQLAGGDALRGSGEGSWTWVL